MFSDGSFVYVPKGVKSPMELSTYFRINASETGQVRRQQHTQRSQADDSAAASHDKSTCGSSTHRSRRQNTAQFGMPEHLWLQHSAAR